MTADRGPGRAPARRSSSSPPQPRDLEGMAACRAFGIPVLADEAVYSLDDVVGDHRRGGRRRAQRVRGQGVGHRASRAPDAHRGRVRDPQHPGQQRRDGPGRGGPDPRRVRRGDAWRRSPATSSATTTTTRTSSRPRWTSTAPSPACRPGRAWACEPRRGPSGGASHDRGRPHPHAVAPRPCPGRGAGGQHRVAARPGRPGEHHLGGPRRRPARGRRGRLARVQHRDPSAGWRGRGRGPGPRERLHRRLRPGRPGPADRLLLGRPRAPGRHGRAGAVPGRPGPPGHQAGSQLPGLRAAGPEPPGASTRTPSSTAGRSCSTRAPHPSGRRPCAMPTRS